MSFDRWTDMVVETKKQRHITRQVVGRWVYRKQSLAVAHWHKQAMAAATYRKVQEMVEKAMGKVERMVLLGSLLKGESREEALAEILDGLGDGTLGTMFNMMGTSPDDDDDEQ